MSSSRAINNRKLCLFSILQLEAGVSTAQPVKVGHAPRARVLVRLGIGVAELGALAVDEEALGAHRMARELAGKVGQGVVGDPVVDHDESAVGIPVVGGWAVDHEAAEDTVEVLRRVVRVVPGTAVLLSNNPISVALSGWDSTLADARDAIINSIVVKAHAVPVNSRSIENHLILNRNLNGITPARLDRGPGKHVVDEMLAIAAVSANIIDGLGHLSDDETILPHRAGRRNTAIKIRVNAVRGQVGSLNRSSTIGSDASDDRSRLDSSALLAKPALAVGGSIAKFVSVLFVVFRTHLDTGATISHAINLGEVVVGSVLAHVAV